MMKRMHIPAIRQSDKFQPPRILEVGDQVEGVVNAWIDRGFGYGFIAVKGARDVFVSARDLLNASALERGDRVRFEVRMDAEGRLRAANVLVDRQAVQPSLLNAASPVSAHSTSETIMRGGRRYDETREHP